MIDEITKNVTVTMNIAATIGFLFLIMVGCHFMGPNAYFTPHAVREFPLWILGFAVGYCGRQLYLNYRNKQ